MTPSSSPGSPRSAPGPAAIRALLHQDPHWAVYALGDLDARRERYCDWFVSGRSVALLYREFGAPILWASGDPALIGQLPPIDACHLQVSEAFLPALQQRFTVDGTRLMHRMSLAPTASVSPPCISSVELLGDADEDDIRALYDDGRATQEEPDFFMRSQLADGTFFGVRREGRLVAAGGTHLYSAAESVGAIGNVYTHRGHRGQGHASAVTAAIVRGLLERGTQTIALNVKSGNAAAIRVYEKLGFRFHASFLEGRATSR